eukprot:gene11239-13283_t
MADNLGMGGVTQLFMAFHKNKKVVLHDRVMDETSEVTTTELYDMFSSMSTNPWAAMKDFAEQWARTRLESLTRATNSEFESIKAADSGGTPLDPLGAEVEAEADAEAEACKLREKTGVERPPNLHEERLPAQRLAPLPGGNGGVDTSHHTSGPQDEKASREGPGKGMLHGTEVQLTMHEPYQPYQLPTTKPPPLVHGKALPRHERNEPDAFYHSADRKDVDLRAVGHSASAVEGNAKLLNNNSWTDSAGSSPGKLLVGAFRAVSRGAGVKIQVQELIMNDEGGLQAV